MAKAFNLTAQINLQGPSSSSIKPIVAQIKRELGGVNIDAKVKIDPKSVKAIESMTQKLQAMNGVLIQAQQNANSLNSVMSSLSNALNGTQAGANKVANAVNKTAMSAKQTAAGLKIATTQMEEFGKQSALAVRRFAAFSVVTSGIYALINAVTSGFKAFIDFDKQLIKLQQVTGQGSIGLRDLEKQISTLAVTLGVSSESLIEVASTLAQAGLSADETRVALAALAKTELAPSFDNITDTTEGAIAALRQFGLQAQDLEAVLGSINAVAAAFAVESKDIITAIQRTGGVFANASKGVSEGKDALNEFIAVFTSVRATTRESAETIATGLRTIFTRIQRSKTIDQLKQFGIELTDLEGKFVGPYEAIKRLSEGLKSLDPRDLRFGQIVEELGGFRQIGKVIPLIQQFSEAQKALGVAQRGQSSLSEAQRKAQESLANQLAKVREQFLLLIRDIGKSSVFQGLFKIVTSLASGLISLASAFKPILPLLAVMGAIKGVSAITQFATGFAGGIGKGGGAKEVGSNIGETISGAKEKQRDIATKKASTAIHENTSAIRTLTTALDILGKKIDINSAALATKQANKPGLNSGGQVMAFARGGVVPGSGNRDTVPAMLQPGEFVIRKKAVETIGSDKLHKMNKFAGGGKAVKQIAGVTGVSEQLKNSVVKTAEEPFRKGNVINDTDKLNANINYIPISERMVQNDIKKKSVSKNILSRLRSESKNEKGKAFEEYLRDSGRTKLTPTDNPLDPVDFAKSGNYAEAKNIQQRLPEEVFIDKLFRAKVKDGSYANVKDTPSSKGNQDINLGSLTVFTRNFAKGGLIQKFLEGGGVKDIAANQGKNIEDVILGFVKELGGIGGVKNYLGVPSNDRTLDSLLRKNGISKNLDKAVETIDKARGAAEQKGTIKAAAMAKAKQLAIVGLDPLGYDKKLSETISNTDSTIHVKGLLEQYAEEAQFLQQGMGNLVQAAARKFQSKAIFGGNKNLAFDFDDTLVSGADIYKPGTNEIDIPGYDDLNKVKESLNAPGVGLTELGQALKSILKSNPEILDQIRILTARPQSNAPLLADKLKSLGLDIPASKITGVRGSRNKPKALGQNEKLIDDLYATVKAVQEQGGEAYPYSPIKQLSGKEQLAANLAAAEGSALQAVLVALGAKGGSIQNEDVDFKTGLGPQAASFFGIDPNIPTEVKRTLSSDAIYKAKVEFANWFKSMGMAEGGQAQTKEEIIQSYIDWGKRNNVNYDASTLEQLAEQKLVQLQEKKKKPKNFGQIALRDQGNRIQATYIKQGMDILAQGLEMRSGEVIADKIRDGLYQVSLSGATKGYGPKLYDVVMEAVTAKGGMLTSDRSSVSDAAKNVWAYYFKNRGDVKKTPLDFKDWTKNNNLVDPKLYGKKETWPPPTDEAWILQSGYSKSPKEINDTSLVQRFAKGGSAQDTVPALLTPGEFVINKKAAQKIGYGKLEKLNKADKMKGYNKGGAVGIVQKFVDGGEINDVEDQLRKLKREKAQITFKIDEKTLNKQIEDATRELQIAFAKLGGGGSGASRRGRFKASPAQSGEELIQRYRESNPGEERGGLSKQEVERFQQMSPEEAKRFSLQENVAFGADYSTTGGMIDSVRTRRKVGIENKSTSELEQMATEDFGKKKSSLVEVEKAQQKLKELESRKITPQVDPKQIEELDTKIAEAQKRLDDLRNKAAATPPTVPPVQPPNIGGGMLPPNGGNGNLPPNGGNPQPPPLPPRGNGPNQPPRLPGTPPPLPNIGSVKAARQAAEEMLLFANKAKAANVSLEEFTDSLKDQTFNQVSATIDTTSRKEDLKMAAIESRKKLITGGPAEVETIKSDLKSKLAELNDSLTSDQLDAATNQLAEDIKTMPWDEAVKKNTILNQSLSRTISSVDAAGKAYDDLAEKFGAGATKQQFGTKEQFTKEFQTRQERSKLRTEMGGKYGRAGEFLSDIAPNLSKKISGNAGANKFVDFTEKLSSTKGIESAMKTGLGKVFGPKLSGVVAGKFGGLIKGLGGPVAAAGAGLSIIGEKLPDIYSSIDKNFGTKLGKSTTAAGIAGGISGLGSGAASGAAIGSIGGAPGAAIGAVIGGFVGAVKGATEAIANKRLENTLESLNKTSHELDKAFTELDNNASAVNFAKVDEKLKASLDVTSSLEKEATANTSYFNPLAYLPGATTKATQKEAQGALAQKAGADIENVSRRTMKEASLMSNEAFSQRYERAQKAKQPGATKADISAAAEGSMIVEQYKKSGKTAADAYRAAYVAEQVKMGRDVGEVMAEVSRNEAKVVEEGKKLVAEREAENLRLIALEKATKAVQIASESLLQTFRKIDGALKRFNDEMSNMDDTLQNSIGDLTGNAKVRGPNRQGEQVLGNIAGYSMQEVQAAANQTAIMAGGGSAGQKVKDSVIIAKTLQDQLPELLKNAAPGTGTDQILDQVETALTGTGASKESIKPVLDDLEKTLKANEASGTSLAELSQSDALKIAGDTAAKGLETAQNIQKQYNDTLAKTIDYLNQQNDLIAQSLDYTRKANDIRLNSELEIARKLGKPLSLAQQNAPFETSVKSMTGGVIAGGSTDPTKIGEAIAAKVEESRGIQTNIDQLRATGPASGSAKDVEAYNQQLTAAQASLGKNKLAIDQANKGLQALASDSSRAANALAAFEAKQQAAGAGVDVLTKIITSDASELADINKQLTAATKISAGTATEQELKSVSFRQAAVGGQDFINQLLPQQVQRENRAKLIRQSLEASGTDLNKTISTYTDQDKEGNPITRNMSINEALQNYVKGEDDPMIKAAREYADIQAKANDVLAKQYKDASDQLTTAINDLTKAITGGSFQQGIQNATAGAAAQQGVQQAVEAAKGGAATVAPGIVESAVNTASQASTVQGLATLPRDLGLVQKGAVANRVKGFAAAVPGFVSGAAGKVASKGGALLGQASKLASPVLSSGKDLAKTAAEAIKPGIVEKATKAVATVSQRGAPVVKAAQDFGSAASTALKPVTDAVKAKGAGLLASGGKLAGNLLPKAGGFLSGAAKVGGAALSKANPFIAPVIGAVQASLQEGEMKKGGGKRGWVERFALNTLTGGQDSSDQSFIGKTLGFKKGGMADKAGAYVGAGTTGALAGAAIGSVVPVLGTAIGAALGGLLGVGSEFYKQMTGGGRGGATAQNQEKQNKMTAMGVAGAVEKSVGDVVGGTKPSSKDPRVLAAEKKVRLAQKDVDRNSGFFGGGPALSIAKRRLADAQKELKATESQVQASTQLTVSDKDNTSAVEANTAAIEAQTKAQQEAATVNPVTNAALSTQEKMNPYLQPLQGAETGPSPLDSLFSSPEAKAQFEAQVEQQNQEMMAKPVSADAAKAFETFATSASGAQFGGAGYGTGSAIKKPPVNNAMVEAMIGPPGGESKTQAENSIIKEATQLANTNTAPPIPAPLGTTPTAAIATAATGAGQIATNNVAGPAGMLANVLSLDENSLGFLKDFGTILNSFGTYVDKLAAIKIPDTIEMKGTHVVDVRISGAAAFEGLKKDFTNMIQDEISKKMAKIWSQSNGSLGEAPSIPGPQE